MGFVDFCAFARNISATRAGSVRPAALPQAGLSLLPGEGTALTTVRLALGLSILVALA